MKIKMHTKIKAIIHPTIAWFLRCGIERSNEREDAV